MSLLNLQRTFVFSSGKRANVHMLLYTLMKRNIGSAVPYATKHSVENRIKMSLKKRLRHVVSETAQVGLYDPKRL